ncbi:MAG: hypothetical protein KIH69_005985 [Anaerolineae bacterium]|nr:hypothetical protein [Anaerolineae bacterium]
MKTTLEIPDDIFRQVKSCAALEGIKLKDFISQALINALAKPMPEDPPRQLHTVEFPLIKARKELPPITNEMVNLALAAQDEEEALAYAKFMRH